MNAKKPPLIAGINFLIVFGALGTICPRGFAQIGKADFATGTKPVSSTAADFNRDGKLDLALAHQADNTVSTFLEKPAQTPTHFLTKKAIALILAGHLAAGADAWTTHRAVSRGAREMNPLIRPWTSSPQIYLAIQSDVALADLLLLKAKNRKIAVGFALLVTAEHIALSVNNYKVAQHPVISISK